MLNEQKREAVGHDIAALFNALPGDKALKIVAPSRSGKSKVLAQLNAEKRLFVASANKTFILCEALRQADSSDIDAELEAKALALDSRFGHSAAPLSTHRTLGASFLNELLSRQ